MSHLVRDDELLDDIERKAIEVLASGEWPDSPYHGPWRAECMVGWLRSAGIELVDADAYQGAVDALNRIRAEVDYALAGMSEDAAALAMDISKILATLKGQ